MTNQRLLLLLGFLFYLHSSDSASAADAVPDDRDIPYFTGTVYPTPQQAQYRDEFVPLERVGLLLGKDVAPEDARVTVLVERLKRHGAQPQMVASADDRSETLILVGETGAHEALLGKLAVPDKREGYLLHCARSGTQNVVFLKGRDFHGLLWAITSFNQLVTTQDERPVARQPVFRTTPSSPESAALHHSKMTIRPVRRGSVPTYSAPTWSSIGSFANRRTGGCRCATRRSSTTGWPAFRRSVPSSRR